MYWIDPACCAGCLTCVDACAVPGALIVQDGRPRIDPQMCTACGECARVCPQGAIVEVVEPVEQKDAHSPDVQQELPSPATKETAASVAHRDVFPLAERIRKVGEVFGAIGGAFASGLAAYDRMRSMRGHGSGAGGMRRRQRWRGGRQR